MWADAHTHRSPSIRHQCADANCWSRELAARTLRSMSAQSRTILTTRSQRSLPEHISPACCERPVLHSCYVHETRRTQRLGDHLPFGLSSRPCVSSQVLYQRIIPTGSLKCRRRTLSDACFATVESLWTCSGTHAAWTATLFNARWPIPAGL